MHRHAVDFYSSLYKTDHCNSSCEAQLFHELPKIDSTSSTALDMQITKPGLIKIHTSVHFMCDKVLCTLLHVSPQFQREMSTEWC